MEIYFKKLNKLQPTVLSTILKLVEESGELSREVYNFRPFMDDEVLSPEGKKAFDNLLGELLDVGQTTATLAFCLDADLSKALKKHVEKLTKKGYVKNPICRMAKNGESITLSLPRLDFDADIIWTCIKISEEAGELVQAAGKLAGLSGETRTVEEKVRNEKIASELLDVAQCCVTMLYILVDKYGIDVHELLRKHEMKLREHGYL